MYIISLAEQTKIFLYSFGFGFILGVFYDVFRIIRLSFTSGKTAVFIQDVLYFTSCGLATFIFILTLNRGEIRAYIILGELLGFILYYFSLGVLAMKLSAAIIKTVHTVFRAVSKPFLYIYKKINESLDKIIKKSSIKVKKIKNKSKFRLKLNRLLLYNLSEKVYGAFHKEKKKEKT